MYVLVVGMFYRMETFECPYVKDLERNEVVFQAALLVVEGHGLRSGQCIDEISTMCMYVCMEQSTMNRLYFTCK